MLEEQGAFYPFGCSVDANGQLGAFGAMAGDNPSPADIYTTLVGSFRSLARDHKISAAAIAIDVNIPAELRPQWPDGIRVDFETIDTPYRTYVPYQLKKKLLSARRTVILAEPITVGSTHEFFGDR